MLKSSADPLIALEALHRSASMSGTTALLQTPPASAMDAVVVTTDHSCVHGSCPREHGEHSLSRPTCAKKYGKHQPHKATQYRKGKDPP